MEFFVQIIYFLFITYSDLLFLKNYLQTVSNNSVKIYVDFWEAPLPLAVRLRRKWMTPWIIEKMKLPILKMNKKQWWYLWIIGSMVYLFGRAILSQKLVSFFQIPPFIYIGSNLKCWKIWMHHSLLVSMSIHRRLFLVFIWWYHRRRPNMHFVWNLCWNQLKCPICVWPKGMRL